MMHKGSRGLGRIARRGFTLAELIVASIILTLVVGATTLCVSQALRSRDAASATGDAFSRAQVAADKIAGDAEQALRDADLLNARLAIVRGGPAGKTSAGLLLFAHQSRPARFTAEAPESDEYEVQYRLEPSGIAASRGGGSPGLYTLWRRTDPVPDETPDGGGVASPVADSIVSLNIEAYDGQAWLNDWDSDNDGYPHALRVVVTATDDAGRRTASARRIIAMDRTPKPVSEEASAEEGEEGGGTTTGGTSTSTGTGSTGGTGGTGGAGGAGGTGRTGGGGGR